MTASSVTSEHRQLRTVDRRCGIGQQELHDSRKFLGRAPGGVLGAGGRDLLALRIDGLDEQQVSRHACALEFLREGEKQRLLPGLAGRVGAALGARAGGGGRADHDDAAPAVGDEVGDEGLQQR